jgi:hypothetical protein
MNCAKRSCETLPDDWIGHAENSAAIGDDT